MQGHVLIHVNGDLSLDQSEKDEGAVSIYDRSGWIIKFEVDVRAFLVIHQRAVVLSDGGARDHHRIVVLLHVQNVHVIEKAAIEATKHNE